MGLANQPRTIALGVARAKGGDYSLAVRVQNALLMEGEEVAAIRHLAKGAVDISTSAKSRNGRYPGTSKNALQFASDVRLLTST